MKGIWSLVSAFRPEVRVMTLEEERVFKKDPDSTRWLAESVKPAPIDDQCNDLVRRSKGPIVTSSSDAYRESMSEDKLSFKVILSRTLWFMPYAHHLAIQAFERVVGTPEGYKDLIEERQAAEDKPVPWEGLECSGADEKAIQQIKGTRVHRLFHTFTETSVFEREDAGWKRVKLDPKPVEQQVIEWQREEGCIPQDHTRSSRDFPNPNGRSITRIVNLQVRFESFADYIQRESQLRMLTEPNTFKAYIKALLASMAPERPPEAQQPAASPDVRAYGYAVDLGAGRPGSDKEG